MELLRSSRVEREPLGDSYEEETVEAQPTSRRRETVSPQIISLPSTDTLKLSAAGHRSKVSFSKRVIWQSPDTGFWFSEDMALCFLERSNSENKSGA